MRSAAICASGVSSDVVALPKSRAMSARIEIDRVRRIEPVAARRHHRQRCDLELGHEGAHGGGVDALGGHAPLQRA